MNGDLMTTPDPRAASAQSVAVEREAMAERLHRLGETTFRSEVFIEAARLLRAVDAPPGGGVAWRDMADAPRDGSIVEVQSALAGNPAIFRAAYIRPVGLVARLWVPVRGQSCGAMPWKDAEIKAWRPDATLTVDPAPNVQALVEAANWLDSNGFADAASALTRHVRATIQAPADDHGEGDAPAWPRWSPPSKPGNVG